MRRHQRRPVPNIVRSPLSRRAHPPARGPVRQGRIAIFPYAIGSVGMTGRRRLEGHRIPPFVRRRHRRGNQVDADVRRRPPTHNMEVGVRSAHPVRFRLAPPEQSDFRSRQPQAGIRPPVDAEASVIPPFSPGAKRRRQQMTRRNEWYRPHKPQGIESSADPRPTAREVRPAKAVEPKLRSPGKCKIPAGTGRLELNPVVFHPPTHRPRPDDRLAAEQQRRTFRQHLLTA